MLTVIYPSCYNAIVIDIKLFSVGCSFSWHQNWNSWCGLKLLKSVEATLHQDEKLSWWFFELISLNSWSKSLKLRSFFNANNGTFDGISTEIIHVWYVNNK